MTISFKNISDGTYDAYISDIHEIYTRSDYYLRFIFKVVDSIFIKHTFSATLKVSGSKGSHFYRWITNLVGHEIDTIDTYSLLGKQCRISVVKIDDNHFSVHPVSHLY